MLTFLSMSCVSGIQSLFKWLRRVWRFFEGERSLPASVLGCRLLFTVCFKLTF